MDFENKVVVVTGASSGIGKELSLQLARKKSKVVLAARQVEALRSIAQQIKDSGGEALVVPTDVTRRHHVEELMRRTESEFGGIDVLINNAGVSKAQGLITENKEWDARETMEVNFMGPLYGVWAVVPYLEKRGGGQIVFVSSIVGKRGVPRSAIYCASKFALQGLTESIRPELAKKNIRVITVCPPGVDTPFFVNNGKESRTRFRLHSVEKIARQIIESAEKEKREVLLTLDAKLMYATSLLFPKLMDWAIAKVKRI